MKNRFSSESGMTLIEIIAAMVILVIIVAGFATVFSFAGTSVFIAGHDAVSSADGRTAADSVLASDFSEGSEDADARIRWKEGAQTSDVSVAHVSIDVPTARGPDGDFNLYRRPPNEIPRENPAYRPFPYLHKVFYDYNGGSKLEFVSPSNWDNLYESYYNDTVLHNNGLISFNFHNVNNLTFNHNDGMPRYPIVRPGFTMVGWLVNETGDIINRENREYDVHRSLFLIAIWECNTCKRTDCDGHYS